MLVIYLFRNDNKIMAEPFTGLGVKETALISGSSSLALVLFGPILGSAIGTSLACTTAGCSISVNLIAGTLGGSSAGAVGAGLGGFLYQRKYKKWLKDNGGKFIYNNRGQLQRLPLAFIPAVPLPVLPAWFIFCLPFLYAVYSSYKRTKRLIKLQEENNALS